MTELFILELELILKATWFHYSLRESIGFLQKNQQVFYFFARPWILTDQGHNPSSVENGD